MNIVALYKTFDGGEFVDASLASIYDHVSAIVMVHSDVSWLGERGNTVKPDAIEWCNQNDKSGKVHHIDFDTDNQEKQYAEGIASIERLKIKPDVVMAIDADEIWEDQYFENAISQISENRSPAYRSNMHTYLKTPFFRVDPPFGSPTVFFREPKHLTTSPRGCASPAKQLSNVWMHHYTYVRKTRDDVARKIKQSCKADRGGDVVVPGWMESVYDNLPNGENLHAFEKHKKVWQRIEKIFRADVPPAMRSAKMMSLWWPDQKQIIHGKESGFLSILDGECDAIYRLSLGRQQAVDLGTYRGVSAVALSLACDRVHTIDFYEDSKKDRLSEYFPISGHSLKNTQEICSRFGNITCESSDTVEAASRWKIPVDVLFVDAEHTESGTINNVAAWVPHLKIGGIIIFHDNNELHPGVQSAIDKLENDDRFRFFAPGPYSGSIAVCEVVSK